MAAYIIGGARFDGTNDYLVRGGGLTAISDSKKGTFSVWIRYDGGDGSANRFLAASTTLAGSTVWFRVGRDTSNLLEIFARNAAGTQILGLASNNAYVAGPAWIHILASWDLSLGASGRHLYVNDVSDINVGVFTNDTIDYTLADWAIGASAAGNNKLNGCQAALWFDNTLFLDLGTESNRRKFISSLKKPVDLGSDGSIPTGTAPVVFQRLDWGDLVAANFAINRGGGGGFTVTGALDPASNSPSGLDEDRSISPKLGPQGQIGHPGPVGPGRSVFKSTFSIFANREAAAAGVTGTGDLIASSASLSGAGISSSTGSGSLAAQVAMLAGVGTSGSTGTGSLITTSAILSGVGISSSTGSGSLAAQTATITGAGISSSTGTGAVAASPAVIAGAGVSGSAGSGALVGQSGSVSGSGTSGSTGTSGLAAQAATIAGAGISGSTGTGVLIAGAAQLSSIEGIFGSGILLAGAALISGVGVSGSTGTGALVAQGASMAGAGASAASGVGALAAQAAVIGGLGISGSFGTGALQAGSAIVVGVESGIVYTTTVEERILYIPRENRTLDIAAELRTLYITKERN